MTWKQYTLRADDDSGRETVGWLQLSLNRGTRITLKHLPGIVWRVTWRSSQELKTPPQQDPALRAVYVSACRDETPEYIRLTVRPWWMRGRYVLTAYWMWRRAGFSRRFSLRQALPIFRLRPTR